MPYIAQVAAGIRPQLQVFGNNYPTPDGTGVRDFIHVVDLAKGHVKALDALPTNSFFTVNLGTGKGYSVLEMIHTFEQVSGQRVPYQFTDRRPGDIACCYADPGLAKNLLSWQAELGLDAMCEDTWRWQQNCASD
jgi:UDP-glucose 4-epimerase